MLAMPCDRSRGKDTVIGPLFNLGLSQVPLQPGFG
jgi:hypothetical protein